MGSAMHIRGADHTSYTVSDLERSLAFYVDILGCEVLWQREITNRYFSQIVGFPDCQVRAAHLRIPGSEHRIELFEYVSPRGTRADIRVNNAGSSHISFLVDDLEAAYGELRSRGVQFLSPPVAIDAGANAGGRAVYILDPDGITMELFQAAPERS